MASAMPEGHHDAASGPELFGGVSGFIGLKGLKASKVQG